MASEAYQIILAVQAADLHVRQLQAQHANHPLRVELDSVRSAGAELDERIEAHGVTIHGVEREMGRLNDEVASLDAKLTLANTRMYDGSVTANKELLALQDEVAMLESKKLALEDRQIQLMEELEALELEASERAEQRAQVAENEAQIRVELDEALLVLDHEIEEGHKQRDVAAEPADPELLAVYESLREEYDGVPIARLVGNSCDGCHMQISAMLVDQLTKAADETVINCEECGRLLVG